MIYNHFTEAAFYIYFLICNKTKNKQLPISKLLALYLSFYLLTPTIDKGSQVNAYRFFRYLKAKKYTKKRLEKPIALNLYFARTLKTEQRKSKVRNEK